MRRFLDWLMRGQVPPVLVATVLGSLPLLNIASGAVVGLVVLRRGALSGAITATAGVVLLALLGAASGLGPVEAAGVMVVMWAAMILVASILRATRSLSLALQVAALLGVVLVVGLFVWFGDPAVFWEQKIKSYLLPALKATYAGSQIDWQAQVPRMAALMSGMAGAWLALQTGCGLLLARWAHAKLDNPGGFRQEYNRLRNGWVATIVASVVFVAAGLTSSALMDNLAIVMLVIFMFQGLAVIHAVAVARHIHLAWMVTFYVIFLVLPLYVLAVIAGLGLVDNWFDVRTRMQAGA